MISTTCRILIGLSLLSPATSAEGAELSSAEKADGFVSIFNGENLDGWVGATDGYEVADGAIVCIEKTGGNLFYGKTLGDFVLRFDVLIPAAGNNGIALRAPNKAGSLVYEGIEIQMLDDPADIYKELQPYQYHGSVYGIVPAKRGSLKPAGEWNSQEITMQGRRIKVVSNGVTIVDADLDEASTPATMDGKDHPGLKNASGHIGFLGHGSPVRFRNLRVKDLSANK